MFAGKQQRCRTFLWTGRTSQITATLRFDFTKIQIGGKDKWLITKQKKNIDGSDKGLLWLTQMENRTDVTEAMNDGINYDESGFQAMIPSRYVEGKEYKIAIAFYVDQERYILKTDQEFVVEDEED